MKKNQLNEHSLVIFLNKMWNWSVPNWRIPVDDIDTSYFYIQWKETVSSWNLIYPTPIKLMLNYRSCIRIFITKDDSIHKYFSYSKKVLTKYLSNFSPSIHIILFFVFGHVKVQIQDVITTSWQKDCIYYNIFYHK